jgi:hypothetical protein
MNLGIIPLDVGGAWTFSSPDGSQQCVAGLSAAQVQGSCNSDLFNWPYPVPAPQPGVAYMAVRTQQLVSVFGDLGGTWQATDGTGGAGSCTVTFQGSTFSASCSGSFTGTVQLTFNGTNLASGTASNGLELSAHKQ